MWIYSQSTGTLTRNDKLVYTGYSGKGRGKNNPALENMPGLGPIPKGNWVIVDRYDSKNVGPFALVLHSVDATPNNDINDRTNRAAFRIHGDSIKHPGEASKGCIILPRVIREEMWYSGDHNLQVID